MMLPRPLVLFLAFCGGAALFAAPLLLAAVALGQPAPPAAAAESPTAQPSASAGNDEILGTLTFRAFDLGFDPTSVEVDKPGRYTVSFVNEGAILHNIAFADGTVVQAEAGHTAEGEVLVPAEGLGYLCSIPGHADAGMTGAITVAGGHAEVPHAGPSQAPGENPTIEPDPNAPAYTPRDPAAPPVADGRIH
ncbi:MAG TPA: plastocyanin/azurin family copper-binding protein, partial [Candidatus Limnocylindria bacterium]|nr:plastocyanin/azurin family copper-binding protein [Candidatus Limnocylindria bacterium]